MRVALLIFTGVGWPLPLRPQMGVQALKVALLARFGTKAYCASRLLSGPEMRQRFALLHRALALLGTPLVPLAPPAAIVPQSEHAARASLRAGRLVRDWGGVEEAVGLKHGSRPSSSSPLVTHPPIRPSPSPTS